MTLQNKLEKVSNALVSITELDGRVYHYFRPHLEAPYCIWAEDGEASALLGENHKQEQSIEGTIDYFTRTEFDSSVDKIQQALNTVENLYWEYTSVQFEEDTNLIHHEWLWRVL